MAGTAAVAETSHTPPEGGSQGNRMSFEVKVPQVGESITEGNSLDVMELDAASHNSVDDIRDIKLSVTTVASAARGAPTSV